MKLLLDLRLITQQPLLGRNVSDQSRGKKPSEHEATYRHYNDPTRGFDCRSQANQHDNERQAKGQCISASHCGCGPIRREDFHLSLGYAGILSSWRTRFLDDSPDDFLLPLGGIHRFAAGSVG